MELQTTLQAIANKWGYAYKDYGNGWHSVDVKIKLGDDKFRYQIVYVKTENDKEGNPKRYLIQSRCGAYTMNLNLYNILKEGGYFNYCTLTVIPEKDKDGKPVENIFVQSAPLIALTNQDLLDEIIYEIGNNADIIEEKYFGGDSH